MRGPAYGSCSTCHRTRPLDENYPYGRCATCRPTGILPHDAMTRALVRPREPYLTLGIEAETGAFLAQDHVEVIDVHLDGRVFVKVKHWAKKPYKVTRACP